ncbi:MAG: hypothetical protein ABIR71_12250 [Chthoniobacterales bacterium]
MRLLNQQRERGSVLVLLFIVLAILGGGFWWLQNANKVSEAEARTFAREAVTRLVMQFDLRFIDARWSPESQTQYPPSYRERMVYYLREMGTPTPDFKMEGTVTFTSRFFDPRGQFRAHLKYPARSAEVDIAVSQPRGHWEIDYLNVTWNEAPVAPEPSAVPAAAESPSAPAATP